jgi:cytochrome c-type biogenesis protein CcmF
MRDSLGRGYHTSAVRGQASRVFGSNLPRELKANVLAVQGSIAAAFLLFIVTTSNPITRLDPTPFDGQGRQRRAPFLLHP